MEYTVEIKINSVKLFGDLFIPKACQGIVIFAHGSGSSRKSPRNIFVAKVLQKVGLGTVLFDLLTEKEDEIYANRFDIPLLAKRLELASKWLKDLPEAKDCKIGYFGASTGAAAALWAAAEIGQEIAAVVSRGGRPDLAGDFLNKLKSPTLLIVGGNDDEVIKLNKQAYEIIKAKKKLAIVPGATHLFEEPGTLEQVADLAAEWFKRYLIG